MCRFIVQTALVCLMVSLLACGQNNDSDSEADATSVQTADRDTTSEQSKKPLADVPPADRLNYYDSPPPMTIDPSKKYIATIHTQKGDIVLELDAFYAPQHVNNFVFLARQGFYDGLTFHRWEPDFVLQGGDPQGSGAGGPGYLIPAEIGLPHVQGAVAMARKSDAVNPEKKSSGSQFYITYRATPFLDGEYTVFGRVVEGFDVVQQMTRGDLMLRVDIGEK